ncbi:AAA domain-containing protein [Heliophilum fasciatum]|uniref:Uncharacterized protein DUF559 n=1 Tax=Heliophilum fasciatum TaxID=35700 RepID=A0A4R2RM27_9FIRM|nr:AAA domain-containing protein [Heliophilum fasciatum]MCW2278211.1 very-short-patch-repair endonuclease/DNA-directed RNA polymerase subunit L [Heliophilum fasciatum]TCP63968.1 uncharacterized protein DUF559 [Heliophilum fasciatum]
MAEVARRRLRQVFQFLQAMNEVRNPAITQVEELPWQLWLDDLPVHPCIVRGMTDDTSAAIDGEQWLLKVRRPVCKEAPPLPAELVGWVAEGWQHIDKKVTIFEKRILRDEQGVAIEVPFTAGRQRARLWSRWAAQRDAWVKAEMPAYRVMQLFTRLFELYSRLEREGERFEIILGDGLLAWNREDREFYHPVLLQRVQLRFDAQVPEFIFQGTGRMPELYTDMLGYFGDDVATAIHRVRVDLEGGRFHPLGGRETARFFQRLITQLSPYGEFVGDSRPPKGGEIPRLGRAPVIFLRSRTLGYSAALERILEDLDRREELPGFLQQIVGVQPAEPGALTASGDQDLEESSNDRQPLLNAMVKASDHELMAAMDVAVALEPAGAGTGAIDPNGYDEQVLLSKEANGEQLRIARQLQTHGAVLVQGPPGTGKTHTIANLIGHFLAEGKRVLVTSYTTKALAVLWEKIVEPLQPLCISVMTESHRQQMERAIDAIAARLGSDDEYTLEREATELAEHRAELLTQLRRLRADLQQARWDEYIPVEVLGEKIAPSEAARWVRAHETTDGWIPAPVQLGAPLPLSQTEWEFLYASNGVLSAQDDQELLADLPAMELLWPPAQFATVVQELRRLHESTREEQRAFWCPLIEEKTPETLRTLAERLEQAVAALQYGQAPPWQRAALLAGMSGEVAMMPWKNLLTLIDEVAGRALQAQEDFITYAPELPASDELPAVDELAALLKDMRSQVAQKGAIPKMTLLWKQPWKKVLQAARVNGREPESVADFSALITLVELRAAQQRLQERWSRQLEPLDAPALATLGEAPEQVAAQIGMQIRHCLYWYRDKWLPLVNELEKLGFTWSAFWETVPLIVGPFGPVERLVRAVEKELPPIMAAQIDRLRMTRLQGEWTELRKRLEQAAPVGQGTTIDGLIQAVLLGNAEAYRQGYLRLHELVTKREIKKQRTALLEKLALVAPNWAQQIKERTARHGSTVAPGDVEKAWKWRQLWTALEARACRPLDDLQGQIHSVSEALRRTTAQLVEKKAWAAQIKRTTGPQRQALMGWKATMRKIGRGMGARVPELMAEARKLMLDCQTAVPVWIMPLNRVVENFDPIKNRFDIVIIDEASQADALALAALYMGSQVVVVGDDQQVSPLAVGADQTQVQRLSDMFLVGIPNRHLYDAQFSVYELAGTVFEPVCLREHFRCVPPIIQFSNQLSYQGKIKPLRDSSDVRLRPFTVAQQVQGAVRSGDKNPREAETIASLLLACTEQPEYAHATFGVISLLGEDQAALIDGLLRRMMAPEEYLRRRIQCGNSAHFQGDERDVIFLSMVYGPEKKALPLLTTGPLDREKKRYNVAASRARDQLWVVYSLNPDVDLKPGDLRRQLIQHALYPEAIDGAEANTEDTSSFVQMVRDWLGQRGYRVTIQWPVGEYRIDLVLEGATGRVALECEGDRFSTPATVAKEVERQAILERLGWRFVRIRGSQFFRDPEGTMAVVVARMAQLGILPEAGRSLPEEAMVPVPAEQPVPLQERVSRRAAEIRQAWASHGKGG